MEKWKTVILSDIHLGSKSSRAEDVWNFLDSVSCQTLILNGDIIDGWSLKRGSKWKEIHSKVLRKIIKIAEKGTEVIWIRGNHDEFLKDFLPFTLGNIAIREDYRFISQSGKTCYVFHGDVLDIFITKAKWLAHLGSIGYDIALWMNRVYNRYREWKGLPYYSISKDIKNKIKKAVDFVNDFENNAIKLAHNKGAEIAICGHIHQPALRETYMNSGDWCENCTALVESYEGNWEILEYHS
jgi:UDP-2,3-diacylglucosamine pyrophosphatase LpxH